MQPLIAIECGHYGANAAERHYHLPEAYVRAIERAGGAPLLLPPCAGLELDDLLRRVDGVVLSGGDDYTGEEFGQRPHPLAEPLTAARREFGPALCRALLQTDLPFLGICLGCQTLNVALGGSLYLDLPDELPESAVVHRRVLKTGSLTAHEVEIPPGTFFSSLWPDSPITVNSSHHQAVRQLAPGCRVGARAPDGVIEAFEVEGRACGLAVQWHPEAMPGDENQQALFSAFLEQVRRSRFVS